ncbi:MAG: peptidoglycan DD-metalloendopeptidase family protein [Coprobacillaceae bacterium]
MKDFIFKNRKVIVFTSIAMLFLIGIAVIQLVIQQSSSFEDVPVVKVDEKEEETPKEQETAADETLIKPVSDDIEIVRYFYDPSYDDAKLENAMVYFEGVYRPNLGVDFSKNGEGFEVVAAMSGTVTKKTNDPLLGWVVTIKNDNGVTTTYQSLKEVTVEKDAKVKQGDVIGTSGENVYESDLKNHLHFILEKDNMALNPETFFGQSLSKIGQ